MPALLRLCSPRTGHHWESQTEAAAEAPEYAHASSAQHQTFSASWWIELLGRCIETMAWNFQMDWAGTQRKLSVHSSCIEVGERWQPNLELQEPSLKGE